MPKEMCLQAAAKERIAAATRKAQSPIVDNRICN